LVFVFCFFCCCFCFFSFSTHHRKKNSNMDSVPQLPSDVWNVIFSFIPFGSDWISVKLVCKKWLELSWQGFDHSVNNNAALKHACNSDHIWFLQQLLKGKGVDPTVDDNWAMQWAIQKRNPQLVRILLQDGRIDPSNLLPSVCGKGH